MIHSQPTIYSKEEVKLVEEQEYLVLICVSGTIKLRTWFKEGTAEATIQGNPNNDMSPVITARTSAC